MDGERTERGRLFSAAEAKKIAGHFGAAFYEKVCRDAAAYSRRWGLSGLRPVDYYSVNVLLTCRSAAHGDAVLKIGPGPSRWFSAECRCLREYAGRRFARMLEADENNAVLLEERVLPGTRLKAEPSLDRRLSVFASLHRGLHAAPADPGAYPAYLEWVERAADRIGAREDCRELARHMRRARDVCRCVAAEWNRPMLLHGDFHGDNILKNGDGGYTLVDPKGVVGDPVFDVPRFLLNEYADSKGGTAAARMDTVRGAIRTLEGSLGIPETVLRQCFYVETALALCWDAEDGPPPAPDDAFFAQAVLEG